MFKQFFTDVKNTFYNKDLYANVEKIGLAHPFWLFFKLSMISAVIVVLALLPTALGFVKDASTFTSRDYFPSELELTIKDGKATTNLTSEPYYVGNEILHEEYRFAESENLILINTKENLTLEDVSEENVFLIVSRSSFIFKDKDELRVMPYASIFEEEVVINKTNTEAFVNAIVDKLYIALTLISIFGVVFLTISNLFVWLAITLVLSLIAVVISKTRNLGLNYGGIYKISMYACVPAIIFDTLTDLTIGIMSFSFLVTVAIFTIVLVWNTQPKTLQQID
jgi:hypothetical protein